jgi:hypothetical protein
MLLHSKSGLHTTSAITVAEARNLTVVDKHTRGLCLHSRIRVSLLTLLLR